ncbi:amidohydrolase [Geomicrobium sp. JCM 19055]|uniref:amidohydrolase n=1 Tax=Geomicrobium sp. JCM 19055 TaxID=1460649 RepID=UPI00045ED90F|nr:amidohydrolase [Geomicrobium sp. JCM 19055]GAJ99747.1 hypothetical protein JCM19055_2775 [Geomicrobium sp. JCM 19055]
MKAFYNGTILKGDGTEVTESALLIDQGKIVDIVGEDTIPEDATKIDVRGGYITPGLIDVHTHLGVSEQGIGKEGADFNETSHPATPEIRALDGCNPREEGFLHALASGVTTVQVLPGSANVIGGEMFTMKTAGEILDEMVIQSPSGMKAALGENPKGVYGGKGKRPITRMGVAAVFREQLYGAIDYIEKRKQGNADVHLGYEQLAKVLRKEIPFRIHAHRADDIITALRLQKEFGFKLTLEHGTEGHYIPDFLKEQGVSISVGPTMSPKSKVETKNKGWQTVMEFELRNMNYAITTDHPVIAINYLVQSASEAVKAGLKQSAAFRAITSNAAKHLGLEGQVGEFNSGMDADVVIWTGHPFLYTTTLVSTWIHGERVYSFEQ